MKIKIANKLPIKQGTYWYMLDGALRLVEVYVAPYRQMKWRCISNEIFGTLPEYMKGLVLNTRPKHWSERIEFE